MTKTPPGDFVRREQPDSRTTESGVSSAESEPQSSRDSNANSECLASEECSGDRGHHGDGEIYEVLPSTGRSLVLKSWTTETVVSDLSEHDFPRQPSSKHSKRRSSTTPHAPLPRTSNSLSDFTIDKLDYSSLGIYGRDQEVSRIKTCFENLVHGISERELILISGFSGTGKTRLAETLQGYIKSKKQHEGLYVKGKFDLKFRNEPYSGFIDACSEICGSISELQARNTSRFESICTKVESALGSELSLLMQVIPALCEVMADPEKMLQEGGSVASDVSSAESKRRFHFAFLRFMRVISELFKPLVFVLDDLQWADLASLELLEVVIADRQNPSLLVVGTYRSNEVDEANVFHRTLREIHEKGKYGGYFKLIEIEISNLNVECVHKIIQKVLKFDDDSSRTIGLSQVCFKKTQGNVFHLLHFLSMLHERHLLQFNFGSLKWTWDIKEIEAKTNATENVVDLLRTKMAELPTDLMEILKLGACLGPTIHYRTLSLVWENSSELDPPVGGFQAALLRGLDLLENRGFVSKASETTSSYHWAHDKIQEAAFSLIPESERSMYGRRIGEILVSELDRDELDSAIFVVANLLNGTESLVSPRIAEPDLARINYQASQKAIRLSAFESAAEYAREGIRVLPENLWEGHYDLALGLFSTGARSEGFVGNVETMERYCNEVLAQEQRPIEDKFDVYNTWIDSISNRGYLQEASDMLLEILGKFNCRFPQNSALIGLGALANIVKVKCTMNSRDVADLTKMENKTRLELMKLLDKLALIQYMMKDARMASTIFRCLNWTLKYGYCSFSPVAFANTGVIVTGVLDDIQGGARYGEMALELLEKLDTRSTNARTKFVVYTVLFPWVKLMRNMLRLLLETYDIGLQLGDTESATWAIYHWATFRYISGSPLDTLDADLVVYTEQMKDLKREQTYVQSRSVRQAVLNLRGKDNRQDPTRFVGMAWTEKELEIAKHEPFFLAGILTFQSSLFTYFGEHLKLADWTIELGPDYLAKVHVSSTHVCMHTCMKGVSCFAAARQTRKKKYAKLGRYFLSKIKRWLDMGNPNVKHYESLLEAEFLAYRGKKYAAVKQYEVAVLLAARAGYQQDAGLASERLGEYHLTDMSDQEEAAYRIGEAIKYWRGWGAIAKVEALEKKYTEILAQPTEVFTITQPIHEEPSYHES